MKKVMQQGCIIIIALISFIQAGAQEPAFKVDPFQVLSGWTYEDVTDKFGEGENIIDTMSGQAYIAGFRYYDTWFDRPCRLEFYFTDINVSKLLLRFIHPNNLKIEEEENRKEVAVKKGLMTGKEFNDSLWKKRMEELPGLFDTIQLSWRRELAYSKWMLEKDSLRSDSIIRDLSQILGKPLREGPTPRTEKDSRYFATWIKNGYSCSLKDFRKYAEVNFSISPAPAGVITEFNLDKNTKLIEKAIIKVKKETVEVSLLGIPMIKDRGVFDHFLFLAVTGSGARYLNEMPEELQGGSNAGLNILDLTGDGIDEVWIHYETRDGTGCTNNFIYTLELLEPLMIFEPMEGFEYDLEGDFLDDYKAMVVIDGSVRKYLQLDREDPEYKNIYDENGALLRPVKLTPGQVKTLESHPYGKGKAHQLKATLPVWGVSTNNTVGYIQAVWDYTSGGWELTSLEIWED